MLISILDVRRIRHHIALSTPKTISTVGCGGCVVEHWTFGQRDWGLKPLPPFRSLGNFVHLTLPVSFGRDSKSRWSLLSGVYARGSK